jgi:hypothetical protein
MPIIDKNYAGSKNTVAGNAAGQRDGKIGKGSEV